MPLIGAVLLGLTFVDRNDGRTQTINAKFKILESGKTDWVPIILGGMAIDHEDRGGLGLQPQRHSFYLSRLGMNIERSERFARGRYNRSRGARSVEELVFANRSEVVASAFDSDSGSEGPETGGEERLRLREEVAGPAVTRRTIPLGQDSELARKARGYSMDVAFEARDVCIVGLPELFLTHLHTRTAEELYNEWMDKP